LKKELEKTPNGLGPDLQSLLIMPVQRLPRYGLLLKELLSKTELHVSEGNIYGLVGKNGFGKTTLLKQMANYEIEGFPKHIRMILVNQEEEISEMTCLQSVLKADEIRQHLVDEENRLSAMQDTVEDPKKTR